MDFRDYLVVRYVYRESVLKRKLKQLAYLYDLVGEELKYCDYEGVLNLVVILKSSYSVGVVNSYLGLLDQYYTYLMEVGDREDNVVKGFRLKGSKPKLYRGFLSSNQLDKIYLSYPKVGHYGGIFTLYTKRNRVLLGLLIYQGLNLSDVKDILLEDVDLERGIIRINAGTSSSKYNSRVLPLDSKQVLDLLEYKDKVRAELLEVMNLGCSNKGLIPLGKKDPLFRNRHQHKKANPEVF